MITNQWSEQRGIESSPSSDRCHAGECDVHDGMKFRRWYATSRQASSSAKIGFYSQQHDWVGPGPLLARNQILLHFSDSALSRWFQLFSECERIAVHTTKNRTFGLQPQVQLLRAGTVGMGSIQYEPERDKCCW